MKRQTPLRRDLFLVDAPVRSVFELVFRGFGEGNYRSNFGRLFHEHSFYGISLILLIWSNRIFHVKNGTPWKLKKYKHE